jgi:hypothetical protein
MKYEVNVARYLRQTATYYIDANDQKTAERIALHRADVEGFDNTDVHEGPIVEACDLIIEGY